MDLQREITQKSLWWLSSSIRGSLVVIDTNEIVVHANEAAHKMMGVDPCQDCIIGWHIEKVFSHTGFTRGQSPLLRSLHEGLPFSNVRVETSRGTFVLDTAPVFSEERVIGAAALGYDISNEERIRRDLHEITMRLTSTNAQMLQHRDALEWFIEYSPMAIISVDKEGLVTSANNTMLRIMGAQREAVIGKHYKETLKFMGLSPDLSLLHHALRGNVMHNVRQNIRDRIYDTSAYSITNPTTGEIMGAIVMATDATDKIRIDSELARLDRLNLVGEMAASIAHEIRNPMTTVRGFLQLLANKPELEAYRKFTDLMIDEIDRANAIISMYLSLARTTTSTQPCDLSALIRSFSPVLNADALMKEMRITYDLRSSSHINANGAEIKQMLANLVKNALEAMASGRTVTIGTEDSGDMVILRVTDQGSGIPNELIPRLGTPFLTTKENGTGLGLSVCYRIAERHGATISVDTNSFGSCFTVAFPRIPRDDAPHDDDRACHEPHQ